MVGVDVFPTEIVIFQGTAVSFRAFLLDLFP